MRDYEYCLTVCSTDFASRSHSTLFMGNILRFKSLASEHLYLLLNEEHEEEEKQEIDLNQRYKSLKVAIDSAKKALELYKGKEKRNLHGMALQLFQLGHLYE